VLLSVGRFLMSEVPLYICLARRQTRRIPIDTFIAHGDRRIPGDSSSLSRALRHQGVQIDTFFSRRAPHGGRRVWGVASPREKERGREGEREIERESVRERDLSHTRASYEPAHGRWPFDDRTCCKEIHVRLVRIEKHKDAAYPHRGLRGLRCLEISRVT